MSGNEQANGILPVQQLRQAIEAGIIAAENDIEQRRFNRPALTCDWQ